MKKVLRFLLILILIVIVGIVILGLVAKKDYQLERSITIKAPKEAVFQQMSVFRNWVNWSPWYEMEPTMQIEYKGTDGQEGSSYTWKGKKTGAGEITAASIKGTSMECNMKFTEPWESLANSYLKAEDAGNGETKATWGFKTHVKFPWNAFMVFQDFDKMLGKDFDRGLEKMKQYVESHPSAGAGTAAISEVQYPGATYAVIRKEMSWGEMDAFFSDVLGKLGKSLQSDIRGNATALYYKWDEQNKRTDLAAGFPVDAGMKAKDGASIVTIAPSAAYKAVHRGSYGESGPIHEALGKHVAAQGRKQNLVIEEYVVGPAMEKDTAKWVTNIYYLVP